MNNISPKDAKITSDVLDRVIEIRRKSGTPKEIPIKVTIDSIFIVKTLLALYQPHPFSQSVFTHLIQEGKRSKGGRNAGPSTPRPAPPKGQWKVDPFLPGEKRSHV